MKSGIREIIEDHLKLVKGNTFWVLILVFLTALVFSSSISNDFTSWDDHHYVTGNRFIKDFSKEGLVTLWTERTGMGGTRLTLTSFMLDYRLWGLNPTLYHAENVVWHLLNAVMLYFLILRLFRKKKIALITALLFAIHPMHVESVAWISERKDVLFTFFLLVCMHAYIRYTAVKKPAGKILYWLAFNLSFLLSWHAKFSAVIIPPLLFLIDYILQRRFTLWLIIEKLPMLAFTSIEVYRIAFGSNARMDFYGKKLVPSAHQTYKYSLFEKSLLASWSLMYYLIHFLFPVRLTAIVPYPVKTEGQFPPEYYLALVAVLIVLAGIVFWLFRAKNNRRALIGGFLFFFISIAPFLHFISIKGVVVVADRYTYVPYIGLSLVLAFVLSEIGIRRLRRYAFAFLLLVILIFSFSSFQRSKVWKNDITLFSSVLKHNPNVLQALNNRGIAYNRAGKFQEAIMDFNRGIEIQPDYKLFYNNRAQSYFQLDSTSLAIADLNRAIALDPHYLEAHLNKVQVLMAMEDYDRAIDVLNQAGELAPYRAKIFMARAKVRLELAQPQEAIADYRRALEVYPTNEIIFYELGRIYNNQQIYDSAISVLLKARELNPDKPEIFNELGRSYNGKQDLKLAKASLDQALTMEPSMARAYNNRGITNFHMNRLEDALKDFNQALELDTAFAKALANRGNLWAYTSEYEKALKDYDQAILLDPDNCLILVNTGNVYFQSGQADAACAEWEKALECGFVAAKDLLVKYCQ